MNYQKFWIPNKKDAKAVFEPDKLKFKDEKVYKVKKVLNKYYVELENGF